MLGAFNTFFGLLTLVCWAFLAITAVCAIVRGDLWRSWLDLVRPNSLKVAALVAVVATLGSLYYSEIAHFVPCEYCWYQRIGIYPLALILTIAAFRDDRDIRVYVLPITAITALVSVYHILMERWPSVFETECSTTVPCSLIWFESFGFITLPMMALTTSVTIGVLMILSGSSRAGDADLAVDDVD
ncbi:MAG: disulfide bond formation protein B [Acidimicrobiia bacterium]|nr:disulfide bond formation protein B [Acidimicrobiia bacterium]